MFPLVLADRRRQLAVELRHSEVLPVVIIAVIVLDVGTNSGNRSGATTRTTLVAGLGNAADLAARHNARHHQRHRILPPTVSFPTIWKHTDRANGSALRYPGSTPGNCRRRFCCSHFPASWSARRGRTLSVACSASFSTVGGRVRDRPVLVAGAQRAAGFSASGYSHPGASPSGAACAGPTTCTT